jgi:peptidoglycan/xylan/chitin deacetylase (PgdA/CDA1 family)
VTGRFIVSLDCEGKWGMADDLKPYHHRLVTDDSLARVYDELVGLFGRYVLPATFAFVLAFTLNAAERERFAPLFEVDDSRQGGWLSHFHAARQRGALGGWFQPHALEAVRQAPQHEIACHSFCHRPMSSLSAADAAAELEAAKSVAAFKGLTFRTFVYPRNKVEHVQALAQQGYLGYRDERRRLPGHLGRATALLEELNLWALPERRPGPTQAPVCIPAGFFFNWRHGARRGIPPAVTVERWRRLLDRAAERDEVAHLWLHPHNLLTARETKSTLEAVLTHAARLASAGRLEPVTQETFCREILAERGAAELTS